MNNFKITISNIQNIKKLEWSIDLTQNQLIGIVGRNSIGKTTFIKAIKNLLSADTFNKTSSPLPSIFNKDSSICYEIDNKKYIFDYNPKLKELDYKGVIPEYIKTEISSELPLPYGERFTFLQSISSKDKIIREKYISKQYDTPCKLIKLYKKIYNSGKFDNLKYVTVKKNRYYFLPFEDDYYLREDYFSSGEYFILSIYRAIHTQPIKKLIIIDEIDISLDARGTN